MADLERRSVFLSYSHQDQEAARLLSSLLTASGTAVWFDEHALVPGADWRKAIADAIGAARVVLVLVGESSLSRTQTEEIRQALSHARRTTGPQIVPVLLPGASLDSLPSALRQYQAIDFREVLTPHLRTGRLAAALSEESEGGLLAEPEEVGDRLRDAGDSIGALPWYEKASHVAQAKLGADHPAVAQLHSKIGATLLDMGNLALAEEKFRRALEINTAALGSTDPSVAADLSNLAVVASNSGRSEEALALLRQALEIYTVQSDADAGSAIATMGNMAAVLSSVGRHDEANALARRVYEKRLKLVGPEHPDTLNAANNLAATLRDLGMLDEAATILLQTAESRERILGAEHPSSLSTLSNLAAVYSDQGNLAEAGALQERVLNSVVALFGPEHPEVIQAANNLALTTARRGNFEEARALLERARYLARRSAPIGVEVASATANLGAILKAQGDLEGAKENFEEALRIYQELYGSEHPTTKRLLYELSDRNITQ